jgi:hypothetical protein
VLPVNHKEHCGVPADQLPHPGLQRKSPCCPVLGDGEEWVVWVDLDSGAAAQGC